MKDSLSERAASTVGRIDKYAGLLALVASVVLGVTDRGPVFVYAFAAVTVAFLTFFLIRVLRAKPPQGPRETNRARRVRHAKRVLAVLGLLAVYGGTGVWTFRIATKPGITVLDVEINEDVVIERLVADYPLVADGTISLDEAVIAYREGDGDVRQHVETRMSGLPVGLPPIELSIWVENTSGSRQIVEDVQVRVYAATWLDDCYAYGPPLNLFVGDVHIQLCPWWSEAALPQTAEPLRAIGTASLEPDAPPELLTLLLRNGDTEDCTEPMEAALAVAIYDIDVEVIYGGGRIARYETRQLIAVPTLRYALGIGDTGLESQTEFGEERSCHQRNLERAGALLDLEPNRLAGSLVQQFAATYRVVRP